MYFHTYIVLHPLLESLNLKSQRTPGKSPFPILVQGAAIVRQARPQSYPYLMIIEAKPLWFLSLLVSPTTISLLIYINEQSYFGVVIQVLTKWCWHCFSPKLWIWLGFAVKKYFKFPGLQMMANANHPLGMLLILCELLLKSPIEEQTYCSMPNNWPGLTIIPNMNGHILPRGCQKQTNKQTFLVLSL